MNNLQGAGVLILVATVWFSILWAAMHFSERWFGNIGAGTLFFLMLNGMVLIVIGSHA
jgi:hypothetical protein